MTSRHDRAGGPVGSAGDQERTRGAHERRAGDPERSVREQRTADGLDHLQAAALELIEAARAFLDVAEEVVGDRDRVADVVATVSGLADAAASAAVGSPPRARPRRPRTPGAGPDPGAGDGAKGRRTAPRSGVEHIEVS